MKLLDIKSHEMPFSVQTGQIYRRSTWRNWRMRK